MITIHHEYGHAEIHSAHAHVFTTGDCPAVTFLTGRNTWKPFAAEYDANGCQIIAISVADAATRAGVPMTFLSEVEAAAAACMKESQGQTLKDQAAGRRDWAAMSQAQRNALNEYALKTEGHTID